MSGCSDQMALRAVLPYGILDSGLIIVVSQFDVLQNRRLLR
jgi:hypothetical protein